MVNQTTDTQRGRSPLTASVAVVCLLAAAVVLLTYWQLHSFPGFGLFSPNQDLVVDLASVRRDVPLLDLLTKGYYTTSTGAYTPGPVYRWALETGALLQDALGIAPDAALVRIWSDPVLWKDAPAWYLTDYGSAGLGIALYNTLLACAAGVTTWRWLKNPVAGVAVMLSPLIVTYANLAFDHGGRTDAHFTLPQPAVGPSLITMTSLLALIAVPAAASRWRAGAAASLLASGLLIQQHLMTLPLALLAAGWATYATIGDARSRGARRAIVALLPGAVPFAPMLLRLIAEGPGSFLPDRDAQGVSFTEGWRGLGAHLRVPSFIAVAFFAAVAVALFLVVRRGQIRKPVAVAVVSVLATGLVQQLLFFPSWRQHYSNWIELVPVTYLLVAVATASMRGKLIGAGVAVLVLVGAANLSTRLDVENWRSTMLAEAADQADWEILRLRELVEGKRVQVNGDDGIAGLVLYLGERSCIMREASLEKGFSWGFCDGEAGPDLLLSRKDLPGRRPFDLVRFRGEDWDTIQVHTP